MSKNMDTMLAGWLSQKTYCNYRSSRYNIYATLTKRNFRKCSDAHVNFAKDSKDLCTDMEKGFTGGSLYYALMDVSEMMRDVDVMK